MTGTGQRILFMLAGLLGRWLIAFYFLTVRVVNEPAAQAEFVWRPGLPGVYAFWHAHQLAAVWHFRRSGVAILISPSKDGEYIARIARSLDFEPVRGSSSRRGAAGLKRMMELARSGRPVAFTPDGPRGPRHSINPGVLAAAQKAGQPVVPFAIGLSAFWELPSWDRFRIPKPFSRGVCGFGRPIHVPPEADAETLRDIGEELRTALLELEARLDDEATKGPSAMSDGFDCE